MAFKDYVTTLDGLKKAVENKVESTTVNKIITCTLAEYNAMSSHPEGVEYHITDDDNTVSNFQAFYDGMFHVGDEVFGLQPPRVPAGIVAIWTDVTSEYDGRYFKADNANDAKTQEAEQLPNIYGSIGCLRNTTVKDGCFSGSYGSIDWPVCADGGYPAGQLGYNVGVFNAAASNPIYTAGGKVRPLTATMKVYRRTA